MRASKREEQVLKLVHPGRYVEIHREPITAAEVMRKNPRHSIARPDVFKFPYIVVRPESVLLPGDVFYIVPNITIHRLLKAREHQDQPSSGKHQAMKNHGHRCNPKQVSPVKTWAGTTPMNLDDHDQHVLKQFQDKNRYVASPQDPDPDPKESLTRQSCIKLGREKVKRSLSSGGPRDLDTKKSLTRQSHVKSGTPERIKKSLSSVGPREQDFEKNLTRQSHARSLPQRTRSALSSVCLEGITKNKNTHQEFEHGNHVDSSMEIRSLCGREYHFNKSNTSQALARIENGDLQINNREQVSPLKSCLRKQDSVRKMQNFRVTFAMPITTTRSQGESWRSF